MNVPRVAIVGAGPSGLYTVATLVACADPIAVDVLDRLPTPYGLVRYGVAPDHARIKSVARVLAKPFANDRVRFLGNIEVGRDVTHEELMAHYDAVVYASGAEEDRRLGVPGEDRCLGAGEFVRWYNGHPAAADRSFALDSVERVAVVGAGNVALDVARVLARTAEELHDTDIPERVLTALEHSAVKDINLVMRRGPADVKFTPAELSQLAELADADVTVDDVPLDGTGADRRALQTLEVLRTLAKAPQHGRKRRIHLRFLVSPVEFRDGVLVVEHNEYAPNGGVRGTGHQETLAADVVVTAVGFRGTAPDSVPFDHESGMVPHIAGRVVRDGSPVPGVYVTGWLKRGPVGVIGTNRPDGAETGAAVLADLRGRPSRGSDIRGLLAARGCVPIDWRGWLRLEEAEKNLGASSGRGRVKIHGLRSMLEICRAVSAESVGG